MKKLSKCLNTLSGKHYLEEELKPIEKSFRDSVTGNDINMAVKQITCQFCNYFLIDDSVKIPKRKNSWRVGSDEEFEYNGEHAPWWKKMSWGD